jgi:hypothetical protein
MNRERGRLIRRQSEEMTVDYVTHALWFNGVPSYIEVLNLAEPLEENELVSLQTLDGRLLSCLVLDGHSDCAVLATI